MLPQKMKYNYLTNRYEPEEEIFSQTIPQLPNLCNSLPSITNQHDVEITRIKAEKEIYLAEKEILNQKIITVSENLKVAILSDPKRNWYQGSFTEKTFFGSRKLFSITIEKR